MANIIQYLQDILSARYGKDVRQSIHDAIEEINNVNEANIGTVQAIADTAQGYASTALQAKTDAQTAQTGAETAQTNAETAEDGAEHWYLQAQQIAESFSGALRPMGTVTFANLPDVEVASAGDMYNISDEFTTTSDFVEGAGIVVPLGSNVYLTTQSKWDILAGSPVTGIKGNSESFYRKGNVNITKENIGLGNVDNESLGNADISAIGDGSVKGAISQINSDSVAVYNSSERNLKTRHFLILGDSYGDESREWPYYTQLFLGVDDSHWHVVAEGGAGFVSNGSILFINQLMNYTGNKDEITDIIICGGANDSVSNSAGDTWWSGVQNNMTAFNTYAKEHYPNAKISLGYIANGVDYLEGGVVSGRVYECREMCKYFYNSKGSELGWNILNNVDLTLSQSIAFISNDGLHPSNFGSNALGHSISQAILTGTCEIIYPLSNACDATQFSGNSQFKYVIRNNETIISFNDFYITAGNITNTFKVAKMNTIGFNKTFNVPCTARIDNYDNLDFQLIPAKLVFDKSDVYLDLFKITNDGTYKTSFTVDSGETGYVRITDIDIIVPTRYLA